MRAVNAGRVLPPIKFEPIPITPLPEVAEADWSQWDDAVAKLDEKSADGRARALAEIDQ